MSDPAEPNSRVRSEHDLSSLAVTAMAALYEVEMFVEMEQVRTRLLARGADLFDEVRDPDGRWRLEYKPMAELVLLHVREIAVAPGSPDDRRREILWALDAAGF